MSKKKKTYCIRNWSDYNKSLVNLGSLTVWFDEESLEKWYCAGPSGKQGRQTLYSDIAIGCMLTLKAVFHLPLRATQDLVLSFVELLKLPIKVANYTTLSQR